MVATDFTAIEIMDHKTAFSSDTCIINNLIIQHLLSSGEHSSTHICDWFSEKLTFTHNYK